MESVMGSYTILITLLAAGMLLIGAEIFVPGAVIGTLGALCLVAGAGMAFTISPVLGGYVTAGVVLLVGITVVLWIKFFPRSPIGRSMTLSEDGKTFKASDSHAGLVGKDGVAHSELRPSGFALIDGKRIDVITEGSLVPQGTPIRVVRVEGNRVIVRKRDS